MQMADPRPTEVDRDSFNLGLEVIGPDDVLCPMTDQAVVRRCHCWNDWPVAALRPRQQLDHERTVS